MKVLIVDDEPIALDRLEHALSCIPEAEIVGRAANGQQALALCRALRPDLVLLDINMPKQDGLSVMQALRDEGDPPEVIFVTALDRHAIRAFELHAADYLMKPVAFDRLREAVRRAEDRLRARTADQRFAALDRLIESLREGRKTAFESSIWVRSRLGVDRIPVAEVTLFRAEGDYVAAQIGERAHLVKDTLAGMAERLDPAQFVRAHRSVIVNIERVKGIRRKPPRGIALLLDNGETIVVGPSYVNAIQAALNTGRWRSDAPGEGG